MANRTINGHPNAFAFETVTVGATAIGLTAATYVSKPTTAEPTRSANFATITVETAPLRYRLDGTDPDASTGHLLNPGDVLTLSTFDDIVKFRGIRTGSSSTIMVTYA